MTNLLQMIDHILGFSNEEKEIRRAIRELRALSDRDLDDLGLSRSSIEAAVRNGRRGVDFNDFHAV
jgi:hypothetical protein